MTNYASEERKFNTPQIPHRNQYDSNSNNQHNINLFLQPHTSVPFRKLYWLEVEEIQKSRMLNVWDLVCNSIKEVKMN